MKKIKLSILFTFMLGHLMAQEIITSPGTVTLPAQPASTKIIASGQSLRVTSTQAIILKDGFHAQAGSDVLLKIASGTIYPVPPLVNNANPELNWVISRTFNANGDTISESKNFFDLGGQALQSQVKSFATKHVLASQPVYDLYGRQAIQSLSAPINSSGFYYKADFLRNSNGVGYHVGNFDLAGKINNPDPLDASQPGTLGWYYSNNNSLDSYVPATGYPYGRTEFMTDGSGAPARSGGIGEVLRLGSGHESYGGNFAVESQLNHYLSLRNTFFNDAAMGNTGQTNLIGEATQSVIRDEQGNWGIAIADKQGNTLMSARPGNWLSVSNTVQLSEYKEEFILDGNQGDYINSISVAGAGKLKVFDNGALIYNGAASAYTPPVSLNSSHIYTLRSNKPLKVSYSVIYSNGKVDRYCEDCFSKIATGNAIGQDFHYFSLAQGSNLNVTGGSINLINLITNNTETNYSNLPAGLYKATAQSGEPQLSYTAGYGDISYNFYNQKSELIAAIAPNGVQQILTNGIGAYSNKTLLPFTDFNEFDKQGRLTKNISTDAGTSEFIYRKDGNIRFSQNAEQRKTGRFSYSNYDEIGRITESGEYLGTDISFETAKTNLNLIHNINIDGGLNNAYKREWSRIHYDLTDNSHGLSNYQQDFIENEVSWTENEHAKTWYSYDEQGRVVWTIRQLDGLGIKTIDYEYDFLGNVLTVAYQKGNTAESFYHHYQFDADQRLLNVQTSTDGANKLQQAAYQYYLHGGLKRVELADNLQGIDYTYTPDGKLKAINHPDGNTDPGKDGLQNSFAADAFGMTLEYFNGDYTRNGTGIASLNTNTNKAYYNGNITAQSWKSIKPSSLGTAYNAPVMSTYEYDDKYQFNNNKYGSPNFSNNTFIESLNINKEHGLSYDANGNIQSLSRNNNVGSQLSLNYHYQANSNKLNSVDNYASYTYDDLGQMVGQQRANGQNFYINYTASGKVAAIYADAAKTQLRVSFVYDESGMRIQKTDHLQNINTYYVYDAMGNVLALYDNNGTGLQQKELPVYAAGRIGIFNRLTNNYQYELSDHLGNVRAVINRNKNGNGQADVVYYSDYYSFGSPLTLANNDYRYGYQGQYAELDKETGWNNFDFRMYDAQIGRWMSTDPMGQYASPYLGMGNNPMISIDKDGKWVHILAGAIIGGAIEGWKLYKAGKLGWNTETFAKVGYGALEGGAIAAAPGLTGAILSSGIGNIGSQMIDNHFAGKKITNINYGEVAASATLGAAGYYLGKPIEDFVVGRLGKIAMKSQARNFSTAANSTFNFIERVNLPWYNRYKGSIGAVVASQLSDQFNSMFLEDRVKNFFNNISRFRGMFIYPGQLIYVGYEYEK
ncbi:RHS repeat domain-containing protein [Pedobacter vanadiisoli]|uniref:RHS repeat domain-containing protein n=1 Tax=Pedobacter vanadiisoli TaxID=1761975 RepID=A0ABW5MGN6_9SPHI